MKCSICGNEIMTIYTTLNGETVCADCANTKTIAEFMASNDMDFDEVTTIDVTAEVIE